MNTYFVTFPFAIIVSAHKNLLQVEDATFVNAK